MNPLKIFNRLSKKNEAVSCEDARDVLLQQTGLRIVCPDDVDETPQVFNSDVNLEEDSEK